MIPYDECSEGEKKCLNGYMRTYENFVRHMDYKKDSNGTISLPRNLSEPIAFEDEIWIRSISTLYRKLTMSAKEPYSFGRNLTILSVLMRKNEKNMNSLDLEKRNFMFQILKVHKKSAWDYIPHAIHKSKDSIFSSQEIVDAIHNEYIFHTDTINPDGPVFENHFESFGDAYLELAYFSILARRGTVLGRLYRYLELYKQGTLLQEIEIPKESSGNTARNK